LASARIVRALDQIIEWRGKPAAIWSDNVPEIISAELIAWANNRKITMLYIQPGKPTQKRFNCTVRHEWLDMHAFDSIAHTQDLATRWLWTTTTNLN
jgi:putative transposase